MRQRGTKLTSVGLIAMVAAVAFAGSAAADSDLVRNGSFEAPAIRPGAMYRQFATGQHVGPWRVTSGSVFTVKAEPPFETPPHGEQAMNLSPPGPGGSSPGDGEICETVHGLVRGSAYKLRFLAASVVSASTIDVTFGGADVAHLEVPGGTFPAPFTRHAWTITAPAHTADLCLHGDATGAEGFPIVDGVRVLPLAD